MIYPLVKLVHMIDLEDKMVIKMLQAVSEMLEGDEVNGNASAEAVRCAKLMLDKVIEGMIDEEKSNAPIPLSDPTIHTDITGKVIPEQHKPANEKTAAEKLRAKLDEKAVQIVVDHGKITEVKNALPDTKIELDGKVYTPAECVGKSFEKGRVL